MNSVASSTLFLDENQDQLGGTSTVVSIIVSHLRLSIGKAWDDSGFLYSLSRPQTNGLESEVVVSTSGTRI